MIKNLLFHNENNDYYPYALRLPALCSYIVFILVFNIFATKLFILSPQQASAQEAIDMNQLYSLINQDRTENNLPTLKENNQLMQAAQAHGEDMFQEQYWGHYSPSGKTPWSFITATGYSYRYAGENLARDFITASEINDAWMNSPEHRSNILSSDYQDIGMSIVTGTLNGEQATIVVQMLASPLVQNTTPLPGATGTLDSDSVSVSGQMIGNTNTYAINVHAPSGNYQKVTASIGNYATVLGSSSQGYSGVVAIPQNVQADNVVQIMAYGANNKVQTLKENLPLTSVSVPPESAFIVEANPFSFFGDWIQRVSLQNQINLLFMAFLTLMVALDAVMFYRLNLKDKRYANPLLHLPLLVVICFVLLFVNKGVIL